MTIREAIALAKEYRDIRHRCQQFEAALTKALEQLVLDEALPQQEREANREALTEELGLELIRQVARERGCR